MADILQLQRGSKNLSPLVNFSFSLQGERASERRRKEESPPENIYDTPKTTSVKWKEDLAAAYDIVSKGSRNGIVSAVNLQLVPADGEDTDDLITVLTDDFVPGEEGGLFYENVGFENQQQQRLAEQEPAIQPHIVQQEVYDFPR